MRTHKVRAAQHMSDCWSALRCSSLLEQISNLHKRFPNVVVSTAQTFRGAHAVPIIQVNENDGAAVSACNRDERWRGGPKLMLHKLTQQILRKLG
jgi:hypothetical protein